MDHFTFILYFSNIGNAYLYCEINPSSNVKQTSDFNVLLLYFSIHKSKFIIFLVPILNIIFSKSFVLQEPFT